MAGLISLALLGSARESLAGATVISGAGANTAALQGKVDEFRAALGALNTNTPGSFMMGRREINWENLRDAQLSPANLAADYYNEVSTRGVIFGATAGTTFQVSGGGGSGQFGNINPTYPAEFTTFSATGLFTPVGSNVMSVSFFVPGLGVPAGVRGFGAVFTDVDRLNGTKLEFFAVNGDTLGAFTAPVLDGGLSFVGVYFNAGERIARVEITCGNKPVGAGNNDVDGLGSSSDVVVMDDFIYGEPIPYPDAWAIVNDGSDDLIRFSTRSPNTIHARVPVANLANSSLAAIDIRPSNGHIYGLGIVTSTGRLVERFPSGSVGVVGPQFTVSGTNIGMDFNPVTDQLRIVSEAEMNILVNPDNADTTVQSGLSPGNPSVVAIANTNNLPGAQGPTLIFGIDSGADSLVQLTGFQNNTVTTLGPLTDNGFQVSTNGASGLDIQGYTDTAFATLTDALVSGFYMVDTDDGNVRKVGTAIGANLSVKGLALVPQTPTNFVVPPAADLVGVDGANHLIKFNSNSPSTTTTVNITGLQAGEQAHEIAYRASDNSFYIVGITDGPGVNDSVGRLYKIDLGSGAATQFGAPFGTALVDGANYGLDANPQHDSFRIFNSSDQQVTISSTGNAFPGTIDHPFLSENLVAAAYDRVDTDPGSKTTLFGIDYATDSLVQIGAVDEGFKPDADELSTVGKTGVVAQSLLVGFDIERGTGTAWASIRADGACRLFNINLTTGYAFRRGTIGNGANDLRGLAAIPPALQGALANISTRLRVETGDNVLIGGFIVTGGAPKDVIIRAIGPSTGIPGALADPTLELYNGNGVLLRANDNWMDAPNKQAIIDSTVPPSDPLESAIRMELPANNAGYTAVIRGANNSTGVAVVEAYDLDLNADSRLANISTRGFVQTGDNVLIAGTIVLGQASQKVIIRAIGPSLPFPGKMENPTLELRNSNGGLIAANDNWKSDQQTEIIATTIPPANDLEAAIVTTLPASGASYTAIVRGVNDATGIAVVEVYALQ